MNQIKPKYKDKKYKYEIDGRLVSLKVYQEATGISMSTLRRRIASLDLPVVCKDRRYLIDTLQTKEHVTTCPSCGKHSIKEEE